MEERIQKILARMGHGSRRQAETLIANGRVYVNGKRVGLGAKADPTVDTITIDGERLDYQERKRRSACLEHPPIRQVPPIPGQISEGNRRSQP